MAYPKVTLAVAAATLIGCAVFSLLRLNVSTDENRLFSPRVKFFRDYLEFDRKFPESQATYILIEARDPLRSPPVARWIELADRISERLRGMPRYVSSVESRVTPFAPGVPAILFDDPRNFPQAARSVAQLAPLARVWGGPPDLLGAAAQGLRPSRTPMQRFLAQASLAPADPDFVKLIGAIAQSWSRVAEHPESAPQLEAGVPSIPEIFAQTPEDVGFTYVPDKTNPTNRLLLIQVYESEGPSASLAEAAEAVDAIRQATFQVAGNFQEFHVGLTGRPVLGADEMKTTDRDSHRSEAIALAVVFIGLVLLLRSIKLAIVAELSLAVAIGWTFGWATITVGELNLLSIVFLIALIGIGMDYLIQILAAYRRETRRYVRPAAVWARVFRYVGPPVNTACLGAAGAFLVSVFTDFRGAAQLGIIAGGGLLLCLLAAYTVLPALLVLFPARLTPYPTSSRYGEAPPRTSRRLILPILWVVLLLLGIPFIRQAQFNPNLLDLQAPRLPSVQLVRKLQTWSAVVLSPDLSMLRNVRDAVQDAPTVASTESILTAFDNARWLRDHASEMPRIDWVEPAAIEPGDLPDIATRSQRLADHLLGMGSPDAQRAAQRLRQFSAQLAAPTSNQAATATALSQWQREFARELKMLMAQLDPPPIQVPQIPTEIRQHLVSTVDQPAGQYLYALYINPKQDLWNRENLGRFQTEVEERVRSVPGAPAVTGITSNIYHTTRAIEESFYAATAYALALIFVLVLLDLRDIRQTLVAVSVLALGLPMLVALMGALHVSWNFANFFGLPILIGAGHEYGVFLMHRYREAMHDPRRVWRRWDPADRALLLCAFVTSSSFGFFWALAHHRGLKSLGLVMALGTACIYLSAILVVRPLLTWRLQYWRRQEEAKSARHQMICG